MREIITFSWEHPRQWGFAEKQARGKETTVFLELSGKLSRFFEFDLQA
jgi:hypothetical protein